MKKLISVVLSLGLFLQLNQAVQASEKQEDNDLNEHYIELYASDLAYVNNVYKIKDKSTKVKDIVGVNSEIKDALSDWKIEAVSKNGGTGNAGFEAIVLKNPDSTKNELIIAFKGSVENQDWIDNGKALNAINTELTQSKGIVYHPQDAEAEAFTSAILKDNPGANIILVGHSLGGHLAQHVKVVLNLVGTKVVTFNSLGVVTESKQTNFLDFAKGNLNFIIDGEIADNTNSNNKITSLGDKDYFKLPNIPLEQEKHRLINFYSFTQKTYSVYQTNKLLKSFYNLNNAKQLASMNLKTSIKNNEGGLIWTNNNRYAIYFHQTLLYTFANRKDSDAFANVQAGRRVLDLTTNKNVYFKTNASFRYNVYLGKDKLDIFTSSTDAIAYAKKQAGRRVFDLKSNKNIYFNTSTAYRYSVYVGKDKLEIFTNSKDAITFAKQGKNRFVKDEKTKKIIYPV